LLIDVREVKTRFKLIKHIDTEKSSSNPRAIETRFVNLLLFFYLTHGHAEIFPEATFFFPPHATSFILRNKGRDDEHGGMRPSQEGKQELNSSETSCDN
jgi:hypothetical protein